MKFSRALLLITITALISVPTFAQLNRAYVSVSSGNDANACSYASPCRSLGAAVGRLNDGGEVIVLDGGGFSPFVIDRPLSIQAPPSVFAGVIAGSGIATDIDTSGRVVLRGLTFTGVGATHGLYLRSGASLHVEDTIVNGFSMAGISGPAITSEVFLRRATIRNNGTGYYVRSGHSASIVDSSFDNNNNGLRVEGEAAAIDTNVTASGSSGFLVSAGTLILERCAATHNATGLSVASATAAVSNSSIVFNNTGISATGGGQAISRGNNTVTLNGSGEIFTGSFSGLTAATPGAKR